MTTHENTGYKTEWWIRDPYYTLEEIRYVERRMKIVPAVLDLRPVRRCRDCGETFHSERKATNQRCLSCKGKHASRARVTMRTCPNWGKQFTQTTTGPQQKWCSVNCKEAANTARRRDKQAQNRRCVECGKTFLARPDARGTYAKTCSRSCRARHQWRARKASVA